MQTTPPQDIRIALTSWDNELQHAPPSGLLVVDPISSAKRMQKYADHSQETKLMKYWTISRASSYPSQKLSPCKLGKFTYCKLGTGSRVLIKHEDGSTKTVPKMYKSSMALHVEHVCTNDRDELSGRVPKTNRQCDIRMVASSLVPRCSNSNLE